MGRLKQAALTATAVSTGLTKMRALKAVGLFQRDAQHMALTREVRSHTTAMLLTAFLGGFLQALASEMRVDQMDGQLIDFVKGGVSLATLVLLYMIWRDYQFTLALARLHGHAHEDDTVWTTDMGPKFLAEMLVCALHCPPWVAFTVTVRDRAAEDDQIDYHIDNVAAVLVSLRCYLAFRLLSVHLSYTSAEARSIGIRNRVALDGRFTFNVLANDHPFWLSLSLMAMALLVLSNALRVAEQPVNDEFFYFWDSVWCAVVTMTTVGYGDIVPVTFIGRVTAFCTCIVGVGVVAMFALSVTNLTSLTPSQVKVKHLLNKSRVRRVHKASAAKLIQAQWRLYYAMYDDPMAAHTTLKILVTRRLRQWRDAQRLWFQVQREDEEYAMSVHQSLATAEAKVCDRVRRLEDEQKALLDAVVKFTSDPDKSLAARVAALEAEVRVCREMLRDFPSMSLHSKPMGVGADSLSLRPGALALQRGYKSPTRAGGGAGKPESGDSDDDSDDDSGEDRLHRLTRGKPSPSKRGSPAAVPSLRVDEMMDVPPPEGASSPVPGRSPPRKKSAEDVDDEKEEAAAEEKDDEDEEDEDEEDDFDMMAALAGGGGVGQRSDGAAARSGGQPPARGRRTTLLTR